MKNVYVPSRNTKLKLLDTFELKLRCMWRNRRFLEYFSNAEVPIGNTISIYLPADSVIQIKNYGIYKHSETIAISILDTPLGKRYKSVVRIPLESFNKIVCEEIV